MAQIACLRCDKFHLDNLPQCPDCGTTNFFAHPDGVVLTAAVGALCEQIEHDHAQERRERLNEVNALRPPKWYHHAYERIKEYL